MFYRQRICQALEYSVVKICLALKSSANRFSFISIRIMVLCKIRVFVPLLLRDKAIDKVLWPYTYLYKQDGRSL